MTAMVATSGRNRAIANVLLANVVSRYRVLLRISTYMMADVYENDKLNQRSKYSYIIIFRAMAPSVELLPEGFAEHSRGAQEVHLPAPRPLPTRRCRKSNFHWSGRVSMGMQVASRKGLFIVNPACTLFMLHCCRIFISLSAYKKGQSWPEWSHSRTHSQLRCCTRQLCSIIYATSFLDERRSKPKMRLGEGLGA